jgi:hypothetical protein
MMPLKQLVQNYTVKKSAEAEPEKDASGYGKASLACCVGAHHVNLTRLKPGW